MRRVSIGVLFSLAVVGSFGPTPKAFAQERPDARELRSLSRPGPVQSIPAAASQVPASVPNAIIERSAPRRPGAMLPLYAGYASLQALDWHSTARSLRRGNTEANPLMQGVAGTPAAMLAVKAATTAGVVYAGEKMWRRNKVGAVAIMIAASSATALVVQHNYRAASRPEPPR